MIRELVRRRLCADCEERVAALEARLDHERRFPAEWANRRVRDRFGDRVLAGPFAGLEFPDWGIARVDLFAPKLLGSYELELRDALEAAIAARPAQVVNVGAGEGYEAVGLAMRLAEARVLAFEAQTDKHALFAQLADRNGVRDRIEIRGAAIPPRWGPSSHRARSSSATSTAASASCSIPRRSRRSPAAS